MSHTGDYENRIVRIKDSADANVAEYTYDALGRRIEKKDLVDSSKTVRYYYNKGWSRRAGKTDTSGLTQRWYIYGNYIDEVLRMSDSSGNDYYYLHDHCIEQTQIPPRDAPRSLHARLHIQHNPI